MMTCVKNLQKMKVNIIKLDENGETLEKLETFLKKQRPIKIEGYENTYKSIENFIKSFTTGKLNKENRTLFINNDTISCSTNRARSIIDLLLVCKTHHPNWSTVDILRVFEKLWNDNKIVGHKCSNINRIVFKVKPFNNWVNMIKLDHLLTKDLDVRLGDLFKKVEEEKTIPCQAISTLIEDVETTGEVKSS
jgi:hypothetical protein